jgi:hypothetical protein
VGPEQRRACVLTLVHPVVLEAMQLISRIRGIKHSGAEQIAGQILP